MRTQKSSTGCQVNHTILPVRTAVSATAPGQKSAELPLSSPPLNSWLRAAGVSSTAYNSVQRETVHKLELVSTFLRFRKLIQCVIPRRNKHFLWVYPSACYICETSGGLSAPGLGTCATSVGACLLGSGRQNTSLAVVYRKLSSSCFGERWREILDRHQTARDGHWEIVHFRMNNPRSIWKGKRGLVETAWACLTVKQENLYCSSAAPDDATRCGEFGQGEKIAQYLRCVCSHQTWNNIKLNSFFVTDTNIDSIIDCKWLSYYMPGYFTYMIIKLTIFRY